MSAVRRRHRIGGRTSAAAVVRTAGLPSGLKGCHETPRYEALCDMTRWWLTVGRVGIDFDCIDLDHFLAEISGDRPLFRSALGCEV